MKKPCDEVERAYTIIPEDYPNVIIDESHRDTIIEYLNRAIKIRYQRLISGQCAGEVKVDKVMHRSGALVLKIKGTLSARWIQLVVTEHHWENLLYKLVFSDREDLNFAPTYIGWVPDERAEFEYFRLKARQSGINTDSWKFIRIIREKKNNAIRLSRKFAFIALDHLEEFLDDKGEIRISYEFFQQKAVIKAVGTAIPRVRGNQTIS